MQGVGKKLKENNIAYVEVEDTSVMTSLGIDSVPVLSIDDVLLNFSKANIWINKQTQGEYLHEYQH